MYEKSGLSFSTLKLTIKVLVLLLILGTVLFVVFQNNGVIDKEEQNILNELRAENNVNVSMYLN